ncbi:hypothetical protein Tco_0552342 [Tanacetum coccineum]
MAGALGAHTPARNLEPLMRDGGGQEEVNRNGGNENGGNGNRGNGNGGNRNRRNEMVMRTEEEMAITSEDLCLLESAHIKTS